MRDFVSTNKLISPIALDMGASNTGVYYAKYASGASFEKIEKQGEVLVYEKDKYTPLLKERTANRHARRCSQRRKFAKRLVHVILEKYFDFPAKEHSQAISFFLNRRGFTFLQEDYSKEHLEHLPSIVWDILPKKVQNILEGPNIGQALDHFTSKEPKKIGELLEAMQENKEVKRLKDLKRDIVYYDYINKIAKACDELLRQKKITENKKERHKLSQASAWILERLIQEGISGLGTIPIKNYQANLMEYLGKLTPARVEKLKEQLPHTAQKEKKAKEAIKSSVWDFELGKFDLAKIVESLSHEDLEDHDEDERYKYIKAHLFNFHYALHRIKLEMESGARFRSVYFENIEKDLKNLAQHSHLYLKNFAKAINQHTKLDNTKFHQLICHISNLELKPLRAYFNDETPVSKGSKDIISHKAANGGDQFHHSKLSRIASTWFMSNWRVSEEKDRQKKVEDYQQLKAKWKEHNNEKKIIDFWLKTDPVLTIPPYQNMNNRHPPHCQSLILNGQYLDAKYPSWKEWLKALETEKLKKYQSNLEILKSKSAVRSLIRDFSLSDKDELSSEKQQKIRHYRLIHNFGVNEQLSREKLEEAGNNRVEARKFQYLLDTSKKIDSLHLNEIWSIYHKIQILKQNKKLSSAEKGLTKELKKELTEKIKTGKFPKSIVKGFDLDKDDSFREKSFGHFINQYYQTRKRAREGRYFLHQEKEGNKKKPKKWLKEGKLLVMCPHRPRQKKHQMLLDVASVLGFHSILGKSEEEQKEELKGKFGKTSIEECLMSIKGFSSTCQKAATAQKDYRGSLRMKVDLIEKLMDQANETEKEKVKNLDKKMKDLYNLVKQCKEKSKMLSEKLYKEEDQNTRDARAKKFESLFSFAQIHNIVFKDRHGFSNTCPICSIDNGVRMQEEKDVAQASRLSAMKVRIIDGLVMRICETVSRHVATTCWEKIKDDLAKGKNVSIPLIFEQNRFEFEPNLRRLKKKIDKKSKERDAQDQASNEEMNTDYVSKQDNIKKASRKICPYSGTKLGNKDGEIDHIIPRASIYGTLNDEANLLYVSQLANQDKNKQSKYLKDLAEQYKKIIFPKKSDEQIEAFIYQKLGGKNAKPETIQVEDDIFAFGPYLSFINLSSEEQVAFRHSLFLDDTDPLKKKVIRSLQNRNRTIVNGTQRYMAQCIADKIYQKAKDAKSEKKVNFDYFEYPSHRTSELRKYYAENEPSIQKEQKQELYSHLIDAQMAFLLAAEGHKGNGSMGLVIDENETIEGGKDKKSGKNFLPLKFFQLSRINEEDPNPYKKVYLEPKTTNSKLTRLIREDTKKFDFGRTFSRYLFKKEALRESYRSLVEFEDKLYVGYPQMMKNGQYDCKTYCKELTSPSDVKMCKKIMETKKYYDLAFHNETIQVYTVKRNNDKYKQIDKDSHRYFSKKILQYSQEEKEEINQINFILEKCRYYVQKTDVIQTPKVLKTANNKKFPFYREWEAFDQGWKKAAGDGYQKDNKDEQYVFKTDKIKSIWNEYCRKQFAPSQKQKESKNQHSKVRKMFSMNSCATPSGTMLRINRQNQDIYQTVAIDNNEVASDYVPFLVQVSKNLALAQKSSEKVLAKKIVLKEELNLKNQPVKTKEFFTENFLKKMKPEKSEHIEILLNNTTVLIKQFPLSKFKTYLNQPKNDISSTIQIQTKANASRALQSDPKLVYAKKEEIDSDIHITTRDGPIQNISVQNKTVEFSLPFKSEDIEKFYKSLE